MLSYHTVAAGETLFSISRRYGNAVEQVAAWNRLTPPYSLSVGQRLIVGQGGSGTTQTGFSRMSSLPTLSQSSASTARGSIGFHTVQPGETLASIARDYRLTTHDLSVWNGIGMPYTVYPGQRLLIVPP
jgi:peptidoglycan DL-endopeptidase LytF